MKKLLLLVLAVMVLAACTNDSVNESINPNSPTQPTQPTPASNEIWYSATAKVEPTFEDSLTFGANVVSNVWDSETKRGIIAFDGDVTMIGEGAFYDCDKFIGVTLPESVTSIGKEAFCDCDGLTECNIPDSVTTIGECAFYYCKSLTSVTIGDSVTTIGESAFSSCTSLTSVNIPDSVTTIGNFAFRDCDSLTSVNIPDSVTTIGDIAFFDCDSLTSVTIGDSVTSIGNGAFSVCESLTEFTGKFVEDNGRILVVNGILTAFAPAGITEYNIPDSVTSIGNYAFWDCTSLTSVNIPDSVTTIGEAAFADCTSLKKVYCYASIPPSLDSSAFSNNVSGRRIYVYEECVEIYKSAWSSYNDSIYTNGQNCPVTTTIEYTTNDGNIITTKNMPVVSNIYENGVGTLVVVGKISQIPEAAFYECSSLTSVTIPDSVTTFGRGAFEYCSSLTSVTIGDSVTTIGYSAFSDCYSLTSVYCKATTPPVLGNSYVFDNNGSGRKIYVPAGSVEAYKNVAEWSEYASAIVGYDFENGVVVE